MVEGPPAETPEWLAEPSPLLELPAPDTLFGSPLELPAPLGAADPVPDPAPPPEPAAPIAPIRINPREIGERPLLVSHGFGLGEAVSHDEGSRVAASPADAQLSLSEEDMRKIADDIATALVDAHAGAVAEARRDQRWDAHLGGVIRDAWADFQACVGTLPASDEHFRAALNRILADGRTVF